MKTTSEGKHYCKYVDVECLIIMSCRLSRSGSIELNGPCDCRETIIVDIQSDINLR